MAILLYVSEKKMIKQVTAGIHIYWVNEVD